MQENKTQNQDEAANQLQRVKALQEELALLLKEEQGLLLEQAEAKRKFRDVNGPFPAVSSISKLSAEELELLLQDNSSQMQFILQHVPIPGLIVEFENGERVVGANQPFFDYTGFTAEDIYSGKVSLSHLSTPDALLQERTRINDFDSALLSQNFESMRITKDGYLRPVAASLRLIDRHPLKYMAFWLDLSELRYLEDSLKERNSIFSAIVEEMPHIVFVANKDGLARQFNQRFYELTGVKKNEDDGNLLKDIIHPQDKGLFERTWARVTAADAQSGKPEKAQIGGDFRLKAQDGEYYWHSFRFMPLKSMNGLLALTVENGMDKDVWQGFTRDDAALWIGTATDIDRRKRVMDEVLESAQAFQSLANQIPQIVWTAAPDGKIEFLNERWYEFSGHSREHKMGLDFALFIHPDDRREYMNRWRSSVKTGDAFEVDFRLREFVERSSRFQVEQDYVKFLARAVALRNYRGEIAQWIGTWTSI